MEIKIDQSKCIGCGICPALAPKSFKMNDENKAEVIVPSEDDENTVKTVVDSCPTGAITLE